MTWRGVTVVFCVSVVIVFLAQAVGVDMPKRSAFLRDITPVALPETALKSSDNPKESVVLPETPYLLMFFSTHCPYCRTVHRTFSETPPPVPVIGVLTQPDVRKQLPVWLQKGNPFRAVAFDADGIWGGTLGVRGIPDIFVVRDGAAVARITGAFSADVWRNEIMPVLQRGDDDVQK